MSRSAAVFATALAVGIFAQGPSLTALGQSSPVWSQAISDSIDRLGIDEIHAGRTPGLAIGVVEDGRLVYARGFGFATVSPHVPMSPDTEFYAGGVSMQFTAAAVLLLAQDGKLKLDDPVSKYVPEFRLGTGITIAQLLTQTSGLPDHTAAPGVSTDLTRSLKLPVLLAALDKMKPAAPAGTAYANNPVNYLLAGLIVERASGVTLSDYVEQHIFIPLVMNHSFLAGDSGISPTRATGYTRAAQGVVTAPMWILCGSPAMPVSLRRSTTSRNGISRCRYCCGSTPFGRCSRRARAPVRRTMGWDG